MFILKAIKTLVFGAGVKETVFERWLQPLCWSEKEPTALLQNAGGPCAVLAPLQVSRIYVQDDRFGSVMGHLKLKLHKLGLVESKAECPLSLGFSFEEMHHGENRGFVFVVAGHGDQVVD